MKQHLLTIALVLLSLTTAFAQLPPNGDFENWTSQGAYEDPDGWATSNLFGSTIGVLPVTKSTDAQSGSYSLRLENKPLPNNDVATGLAVIGMGMLPSSPPLPYATTIPDSFTGYFKFLPNGVDTFLIAAVLTQWDPVNNEQIEVGGAGVIVTDSAASWTRFSSAYEPHPTNGGLTPDSINFIIIMIGDGQNAVLGSVAYVDNLALVGGSSSGVPNAPSNLAANPLKTSANGGIELTWTDNSTDEQGFIVQRSTDGSTWTTIDSTATDVATFTDQSLADGTQYYYQILAYNASGNSAPSNTADATTTTVGISNVLSVTALQIYPNPSQGTVHLDLDADGIVGVAVYNLAGKLLQTQQFQSQGRLNETLDLSSLESGMYFIHVQTTAGLAVRKISLAK